MNLMFMTKFDEEDLGQVKTEVFSKFMYFYWHILKGIIKVPSVRLKQMSMSEQVSVPTKLPRMISG